MLPPIPLDPTDLQNPVLSYSPDLEAEVEERKRRHESTKQLLVSSMGKRTALNEELLKLKEKNKEKEKEGYRPGDHNQNVTGERVTKILVVCSMKYSKLF